MMLSATKVSPDSIPSLSATTTASTPSDEVVRYLFPILPDDGNDSDVQHATDQCLQIEVDSESLFGSDISVASEGTHASNDYERDNRTGQNQYRDTESPPADDSEVKHFPGCHGSLNHLTPNFTSTMFNIFNSSQTKDVYDDTRSIAANSVNDAVTEVASNIDHSIVLWERKIDSLEREITTLKGIIKSDSLTILRLKTALSEYQENDVPSHDDVISKQVNDLSMLQLLEYEETIQHLHEEIEVLTKKDDTEEKNNNNEERLQLENELFASQIVESETEIRATRDIISQIAEENVKLNMELSVLRTPPEQQQQQETVGMEMTSGPSVLLRADVVDLKNRLFDIEQKLESGFYCQCRQLPIPVYENTSSTLVNEESNIVEHDSCEPFRNVDHDADMEEKPHDVIGSDIEVTITGAIITATGTEPATELSKQQIPNNRTPSVGNTTDPSNAPQKKQPTLETVEADCNFCECLRATSTTNESDK